MRAPNRTTHASGQVPVNKCNPSQRRGQQPCLIGKRNILAPRREALLVGTPQSLSAAEGPLAWEHTTGCYEYNRENTCLVEEGPPGIPIVSVVDAVVECQGEENPGFWGREESTPLRIGVAARRALGCKTPSFLVADGARQLLGRTRVSDISSSPDRGNSICSKS
jgi:hypothetical protein